MYYYQKIYIFIININVEKMHSEGVKDQDEETKEENSTEIRILRSDLSEFKKFNLKKSRKKKYSLKRKIEILYEIIVISRDELANEFKVRL